MAIVRKVEDQVMRKSSFCDEMASELDLKKVNELVFGLGDFNGHVGKFVNGFEGVHGGYGVGREI